MNTPEELEPALGNPAPASTESEILKRRASGLEVASALMLASSIGASVVGGFIMFDPEWQSP